MFIGANGCLWDIRPDHYDDRLQLCPYIELPAIRPGQSASFVIADENQPAANCVGVLVPQNFNSFSGTLVVTVSLGTELDGPFTATYSAGQKSVVMRWRNYSPGTGSWSLVDWPQHLASPQIWEELGVFQATD